MQPKQSNPMNTNKSNDNNTNSSKYGIGVIGLALTVPSMIPSNLVPYANFFAKNASKWGVIALSGIIIYNLADVLFERLDKKN